MNTIVIVTGGFDPIHSGHIEYLKAAKTLGDILVVGVNSDEWLVRKKGQAFMPLDERVSIIKNLKMVDDCIVFDDTNGDAIDAINRVKNLYPDNRYIFANGGDRTASNIPEMSVKNVEFAFGVGGTNKKNSSSWILTEWKSPKTERPWGYYRVLHDVPGIKVKELTVNPQSSLSMQRHESRSEYWMVAEGTATVTSSDSISTLVTHDEYHVPEHTWHQLSNITDRPLRIIEIQYGESCVEEDIERK
jgi:D-beta-D-heptose 7-phosphate kinase/D-beta-D-heptose 1-phosphate adenosyltransferase